MLTRIIDVSARNPFLVLLLTAAASVGGWWSMRHVPLDAIPDLGDTQVIIYSRWERSPDLIEDQVTYPIVSAMLGAPRVKTVRGLSDFGFSFVYVIFDEGTDIYWARARTLEYLSAVLPRLPENVTTELGPDANGLGWVFQYALVDRSGTRTLADLRSVQDWYLRYQLKAVAGVSDVASLGGHVRQYQVEVDPNRLRAYGLSITAVVDAVRSGNSDTGGRLIEFGGTEYMVRGRGYAQSLQDFESIVLTTTGQGAPVRVKDVGRVSLGPDLRRGVADLDGDGEVVSGVVIMRQGENAMAVIDRVKTKLAEVAGGLPPGVTVVPVYDRSVLIERSIATLETTLLEIGITVSAVILLFLWHLPSAIIPVIVIPVTVLVSFIPFGYLGISANIMSLGGIAIAIGALVDASIVIVEQTHKKLEIWNRHGRPGDSREVILAAIKEVAAPSFFALLVIAVAFLPVLTLEAEEGRLFRPLAYTKTLGMIVAAVLAITLDPALRLLLTRVLRFDFRPAWFCGAANALLVGTVHPEERHPVSRWLMRVYRPAAMWSLDHKGFVLGGALALVLTTVPVYQQLGSEFMPPLDEEVLFYMPSTGPGISIAEAGRLLRLTDRAIRQFPEVARVLGKAGRAETPTDSAPLSMFESIITLRPRSEWRVVDTWYSGWAPEWLKVVLRRITSDRLSQEELVRQLNEAVTLPGLSNAWTMPIRGRTAMLTTGIRTPVGLKIAGSDPATIEELGTRIEHILASVPGARSVFAERVSVGHFLDVRWKREELARYGISLDAAQSVVEHAIGGENVSTTIEGRERYPVNVRYQADFRTDLDAIGRITVADAGGRRRIPVAELAEVATTTGPAMIRNEDGLLTGYVLIDLADRDPGGYVAAAREVLAAGLTLPPGYVVSWSGQYEAMARVTERLRVVVPLTLFAVLVLLYLNTRSWIKTWLILLAMPFSAVGAIWLLYLLGYNMSVGVWVGLIALVGVDAGTGVFMLLYLDLAYAEAKAAGRLRNPRDLRDAILAGAVSRLRPKFMTAATMMIGMMPIMWSAGTGSDVMKRIAAPMIGGMVTSFLLELLIYPPLYEIWKSKSLLPERVETDPETRVEVAGVPAVAD